MKRSAKPAPERRQLLSETYIKAASVPIMRIIHSSNETGLSFARTRSALRHQRLAFTREGWLAHPLRRRSCPRCTAAARRRAASRCCSARKPISSQFKARRKRRHLVRVGDPYSLAADVTDALMLVPVALVRQRFVNAVIKVGVVREDDMAADLCQASTSIPSKPIVKRGSTSKRKPSSVTSVLARPPASFDASTMR